MENSIVLEEAGTQAELASDFGKPATASNKKCFMQTAKNCTLERCTGALEQLWHCLHQKERRKKRGDEMHCQTSCMRGIKLLILTSLHLESLPKGMRAGTTLGPLQEDARTPHHLTVL